MRNCSLVIMDAGPLIKLALADQLDLLLCFDLEIFVPDEVFFEAVEKHAWEHRSPLAADKVRLNKWIEQQIAAGRLSCPQTLVGEMARRKRESGDYSPGAKNHRKNTGELAAHDFFNNREEWGHPGEPALLLIDDGPGIDKLRLQNLDVYILSTYALLVACEEEQLVASADAVWAEIERAMPTVQKADVAESVQRDTEFRPSMRRKPSAG